MLPRASFPTGAAFKPGLLLILWPEAPHFTTTMFRPPSNVTVFLLLKRTIARYEIETEVLTNPLIPILVISRTRRQLPVVCAEWFLWSLDPKSTWALRREGVKFSLSVGYTEDTRLPDDCCCNIPLSSPRSIAAKRRRHCESVANKGIRETRG